MGRLAPGEQVTFTAHADVLSFSAYERSGRSVATLMANLDAALRPLGATRVNVEVTRNPVVSDVANMRITMQPREPLEFGITLGRPTGLNATILDALNRGTPASITSTPQWFSQHTERGSFVGLVANIIPSVSPLAEAVIDESSIRRGDSAEPPPTASSRIGRAIGGALGASTRSTDPTRDLANTSQNNAVSWPWWVYALAIGGSVAGAAVLSAYVWRAYK